MHGTLLKHKYADNVKGIVFFFSVEYILSFGFSVGFEGKIKMLKWYYVAIVNLARSDRHDFICNFPSISCGLRQMK